MEWHARVSKNKQALKFIQKRVGTYICAKRKKEELRSVLPAMRKAAATIKPFQKKKKKKKQILDIF